MTGILEFLSSVDVSLFRFFNGQLANPISDRLMTVITNTAYLRIVAAVAALFWLWKGKRKGRWAAAFALVAWGIADFGNSNWIKPIFARPRPCLTLSDVHLLVGCGETYSFPSGHAATSFALATFLSLAYPHAKVVLIFLAGLIAYSRIAVGVHYPFDTLAGMAEGALLGYLFFRLFMTLKSFWQKKGWRGGW